MKTSLVLLGAASVILCAPLHAAIVYSTDFGATTDITNNFTIVDNTDYSWNATAGVGGGAGLAGAATTNAASYNYNGLSFDLSAGAITLSLDFAANYTAGNNRAVGQIGVVSATTQAFTNTVGMNFISARLSPTSAGASTWQMQANFRTNDPVLTQQIGTNFTLTTGQWYRHELTISRSGNADQFLLSGSLTSLGVDGTTVGSVVTSYTDYLVTNAPVYADSTLIAGFRSRGTEGPKLDNFSISVVPEPSTYAAILGLIAMAFAFLRRRR
ncbi:MAG: PEP-CTERM sorting domain-containing protein [Verrucomicrobiota bacterium]|nr:PEP-CTERM sorting domain-containing protein [Verrucomicrobiota bacterium]